MSLFFKQFKRPGLAQLAYLVGDRSKGIAALIDPLSRLDRGKYPQAKRL